MPYLVEIWRHSLRVIDLLFGICFLYPLRSPSPVAVLCSPIRRPCKDGMRPGCWVYSVAAAQKGAPFPPRLSGIVGRYLECMLIAHDFRSCPFLPVKFSTRVHELCCDRLVSLFKALCSACYHRMQNHSGYDADTC